VTVLFIPEKVACPLFSISVVNSYPLLFWKIHFLKENMKYWLAIFPYWREEQKERRSIYKKSLLAIFLINIYNNVRNSEHISKIANI